MKKVKWWYAAILGAAMVCLVPSCNAVPNQVTIGEDEYELDKAFFEGQGENQDTEETSYLVDVYLVSDGVDLMAGSGSGAVVFVRLNSPEETLTEGAYTFEMDGAITISRDPGTIADGYFVAGNLDDPSFRDYILDGTVDVSRSGDTYTFEINVETTDRTSVVGSFNGDPGSVDDLRNQ